MANWGRDFAIGLESGLTLGEKFREGRLRGNMADLSKRKLEQTEEGYKYGDQTFGFAPTPEYLAALDMADAAKVQMEYGDTEKALATRADAVKNMSAALSGMARRAYATKDPQAMVQLYSLYNNGHNARLEQNPDGTMRVLHFPDATPDQAEEVFAGSPQAILDWGMNMANPELFDEMAKSQLNTDYIRHSMLQGDRSYALQLQGQDLQRQQFGLQQQQFDYGRGKDTLNFAAKYGDAPLIEQSLRGMGLGGGGNGPSFSPAVMRFQPLVEQVSQETGVPVGLGLAVIQAESAGDPLARSRVGAGGLMQLMPGTAAGLGVQNRFNPEQNVRGGMGYLAEMLQKYNGNVTHALAAYNAGPGAFDNYLAGKQELPAETKQYVSTVMGLLRGGMDYGQTAQRMYEDRQARETRGRAAPKLPGGLANFDPQVVREEALAAAREQYKDAPNSALIPELANKLYQERLSQYIRDRNQMGLGLEAGASDAAPDMLTALATSLGIAPEELLSALQPTDDVTE